MPAAMSTGIFVPEILRNVNRAAERVNPQGVAAQALDRARDRVADFAAKRSQITNKLRIIQACATRGRGMTRADLDAALEEAIRELQQL